MKYHMGAKVLSIWMTPDLSAVESAQKVLDGKSSEGPIGSISKQKITKNAINWTESRLLQR